VNPAKLIVRTTENKSRSSKTREIHSLLGSSPFRWTRSLSARSVN